VKPADSTSRAQPAPAPGAAPLRASRVRSLARPLLWAAAGALLILLLSQLPATHRLDVGGYDAAYVQGFHEPERAGGEGAPAPYLDGSDGTARWTTSSAALIFPQAGLPGEVSVRLRGWRADGPPPTVTLLLNGATELARFQATGDWEEHRLPIAGGWLKASDFFIEIRADTAPLADGREAGVLIDRAGYRVRAPAAPYPSQLAYGAAAGALLWALTRREEGGRRGSPYLFPAAGLLAYGLAWLLLYRLQPPLYPHPLRSLPPLTVLALAAALALRDGPALAARLPRIVSAAAPLAVIGAWTGATLWMARGHVTLSRPGVENDFRVFATRKGLAQIFSADGFYNLGYPLLLWLARPLAEDNAFLAGRLVAAACGALLLAAGYWLARTLLPPGPAFVALLALALNGLVAQYGLYVGSDMPFAACVALCVAALTASGYWRLSTEDKGGLALAALAGLFGGLAFLMRHLGLVLLPWGLLTLLAAALRRDPATGRLRLPPPNLRYAIAYALTFVLAMAPQLIVNTAQAGQPLYNQQAKNIWLAVYGGTDWGRWDEAPNTIGLAEVVLQDPARFLGNWWRNMVGYAGSGAEDTSEFGRALQLRLLGWPANWLAVAGLLWWLLLVVRRPASQLPLLSLLLLVLIYVAAVSTAFTLQRFFLPLAPIYAVAAGWAVGRLARGGQVLLGAALALSVVLWGGYGAGARYVLASQPADEVAAVRMVSATLPPDGLIAARVASRLPLAKYSALAHRVVDWPAGSTLESPVTAADLEAARAAGAAYLLWDEATGPPPLAAPEAARIAGGGRYALYRLEP
jgi:4-amino-4-deoxy-L-arabinose transferase-like glycosyltransferase